jgi:hypothetical protein
MSQYFISGLLMYEDCFYTHCLLKISRGKGDRRFGRPHILRNKVITKEFFAVYPLLNLWYELFVAAACWN